MYFCSYNFLSFSSLGFFWFRPYDGLLLGPDHVSLRVCSGNQGPFLRPTRKIKPFLQEAWVQKDLFCQCDWPCRMQKLLLWICVSEPLPAYVCFSLGSTVPLSLDWTLEGLWGSLNQEASLGHTRRGALCTTMESQRIRGGQEHRQHLCQALSLY